MLRRGKRKWVKDLIRVVDENRYEVAAQVAIYQALSMLSKY